MANNSASQQYSGDNVSFESLRKAIPSYCFRSNNLLSAMYVLGDLAFASILFIAALCYIPSVQSTSIRILLWTTYSVFEGYVFTGIWILAHECGHGALFSSSSANSVIGWALHSLVLVPFFSWKYTHALHHQYTNHMDKDTAFVPNKQASQSWGERFAKILHLSNDSPLLNIFLLLGQQLFGWPMYLLAYISAGANSVPTSPSKSQIFASHFMPFKSLFKASQQRYILISDLGIVLVLILLRHLSTIAGVYPVLLAYGLPYLWVNHWIVAITYLHHTHPDILHFEKEAWRHLDGALSTVDREFGFVGRYLFHGIIEFHVIHHLFPRIPFYHAEVATKAILPVLGYRYHRDSTPLMNALWTTFSKCKFLTSNGQKRGALVWA